MRKLFTSNTLSLASGQIISGVANRVQTLRILHGRVWITVEGIPYDYFLHTGDTFTAVPGRLTVIEAVQEAHIDLHRPKAKHALHRIGLWLSTAMQSNTVQTSLKRHHTCEAC